MAERNKKNLNDLKSTSPYDVKSARKKIRSFISSRSRKTEEQTSNSAVERRNSRNLNSKDSREDHTSYTFTNEFPSDNISRLDSRLTSYETHNSEAHDNLRKELEAKINIAKTANFKEIEKVEKRCRDYVESKTKESKLFTLFKWVISIAVPIAIFLFTNYYIKTANKVSENEKSIIKIEFKLNNLQKQMKDSIGYKK